jgi:hypothetical protein
MATHEIKANLDVDGEVKGTSLDLNGNAQIDGTLTVGVDDTGYDVKFFGATSGKYLHWDESADALKLKDSTYLYLGNGNDLQLYHNGTNNYIETYAGDLYITQHTDDSDIIFRSDDGSGGVTTYLRIDGGDGNTRFVKDLKLSDNVKALFGGSNDLQVYHDASNSYITNHTGSLYVQNNTNDSDIFFQSDDGSGGITTYFSLDGSHTETVFSQNARFADNVVAKFGDSSDLQIYHNASNSYIYQVGTGDLYILNSTDDKDIIFGSDDGSGGVATYLTLDGSEGHTVASKEINFANGVPATFGNTAGGDLEIKEQSGNSYIMNMTGDLVIQNHANDKDILFKSDDGSGGVETYFFLDGSANTGNYPVTTFPDNSSIALGTGQDMYLAHNGTDTSITNFVGHINIFNRADDKDIVLGTDDGSGGYTAYLTLDGSSNRIEIAKNMRLADNVSLLVGGSSDLYLKHDGSNSYISQGGTGNLYIQQNTADADLVLQCDDGSGGTTAYLTLDGVNARTRFDKNFRAMDNVKAQFGDSSDLEIYHDSSNSYIKDTGTGSLFLQASDIFLKTNTSENAISCASNGAVTLYYDNAAKLATKSDGVDITGELQADSLDIDGNADISGTCVTGNLECSDLDIGGTATGDGSGLTDLNGSQVTTGTIAAARVATLNQSTTGTAAIATTVTVADESSDTSCNVLFTTAATGNLGPKSGTNLTFNSSSGILTATGFAGALTGNVTGNASGSSGSCTGNAATATTAALATQSTIVANNSANETCYPVFVDGATGAQGLETDTGWTFNPSTGTLTTQKLATDVASIVENNKDGSALMTLTGQGAGNESNISLKMAGTSNGNPIKMKMTALDSSGSSVGAGILSYDADDDSFGIGQSSSHNRMAIKMENTITSPVDGSTYVYYEPTSIKAREYVASSNSSHYDFNGDIMRNGNDTTVRGKMYVFKNGTWTITNADTKLDSNGLLGMALGTNSTTHGMLLKGTFTLDYDPGGAGNPLYISTTDGVASTTVPSTSGHIVRLVGYLIGGTHGNIFFDPDKTYIEVA